MTLVLLSDSTTGTPEATAAAPEALAEVVYRLLAGDDAVAVARFRVALDAFSADREVAGGANDCGIAASLAAGDGLWVEVPDGDSTGSDPAIDSERDSAARESALALLVAADAVVDADRFRSAGPEILALADAAWMFAMAGTAARWGTGQSPLLLICGRRQ